MRPRIYIQGETVNIGLKWTDLSKEAVDVSGADEIKVSIVQRVMRRTLATYTKTEGTMVVSEDKCLVTIPSATTANAMGMHDIIIEITQGTETQKAIADMPVLFVKPY